MAVWLHLEQGAAQPGAVVASGLWCWDPPISFRRAPAQVAVLCHLTDTDESNGALRALPGSHHRSIALHAYLPTPHSDEADRLPRDHPSMTESAGQTTVAVRPGDAVVLDYRLLHGTHVNSTLQRRDCILLSFHSGLARISSELQALARLRETALVASCGYANLLRRYAGTPARLTINCVAPYDFEARL